MGAFDDVNFSGLCLCGCGGRTPIATADDKKRKGCVKGYPRRFIAGHNGRLPVVTDYRKVMTETGEPIRVHRLRAERALGKPLPSRAVVHHADGTKRDDAQLVICEDQAYHMLLHARMRVRAAGGNPNTDALCGACRCVKPHAAFHANRHGAFGISTKCRACTSLANRAFYLRKTTAQQVTA